MGSQCCKCQGDSGKAGKGSGTSSSSSKGSRNDRRLLGDRFHVARKDGHAVQLSLTRVSRDDSGRYTLTASNSSGESRAGYDLRVDSRMSMSDSLSVPTHDDAPHFLRSLADLAVKVGTRTRFLVEIRSPSDLKVTWLRNDRPVKETDRFQFVNEGNFWCVDVGPVMVEDHGRWTCVAENDAGRSACACELSVLVPKAYKGPEFLEELRALLTEQGTVSLECKVVGVPTPALRWYKDAKEIRAGDVFALTADASDPTSLGTYTCEAVNCMGRAYSSSRVHVVGRGSREGSLKPADCLLPTGPPPTFDEEISHEKARIGDSLTLSCHVQVPPWPKSIQWYNSEGRVETGDRYRILEDGLGGYSVEISALEASDDGEWKCVATSFEGVRGISTAVVTLTYPKNYRKPRFLESLRAILTEEGLVSFECKVVGFPTPQLRWFKDGQELRPGDVYQLTGTNSLGSYCCIARNCMGEASSTAELTVEDIQSQLSEEERLSLFSSDSVPHFVRGLRSQEARVGDNFRFTVQVSVAPEPKLEWFRDDDPIVEGDKFQVTRENLGTCHLDIRPIDINDQAEWKCVATNDFGHSVTSCFLKLTIPKHFKKPRFLECLRAVLSEEGAVNLECKVIGVPQPVLKWYKDGEELKPGDIHRIISGQDGTCCLGTYTCEATNCMGTVASSASLVGFEERGSPKSGAARAPQPIVRDPSLSTIHEERTSQMHDAEQSLSDERGEVSFSFDGKEVSVSLYETPDLTEEEALQVVEMYADELSEHISEHNIVELPPLRFMKESSTSGNLLMEAVLVDVSPDYFGPAGEEDLRTDADMDEFSISDEAMTLHTPNEDEEKSERLDSEEIFDRALEPLARSGLSNEENPPKRPPRKTRKDLVDSKSGSKESRSLEEKSDSYSDAKGHSLEMDTSYRSAQENITDENHSGKASKRKSSGSDESSSKIRKAESAKLQKKIGNVSDTQDAENTTKSPSKLGKRGRTASGGSNSATEDDTIYEENIPKKPQLASKDAVVPEYQTGQISVLDSLSHSLQSIQNGLSLVENQVASQSLDNKSAKESFGILDDLSQSLQEIQKGLSLIEQHVDEESVVPPGLTEMSILETLAQPLQEFTHKLALVEQQSVLGGTEETLLERTTHSIMESVSQPMQEIQRELGLIHQRAALGMGEDFVTERLQILCVPSGRSSAGESDVTPKRTTVEDSDAKMKASLSLQTLSEPVTELLNALDKFQSDVVRFDEGDILSDKPKFASLEKLLFPMKVLKTEIELIEQQAITEADDKMHHGKSLSILEAVSQPMDELRRGIALVEQQAVMDAGKEFCSVSLLENLEKPIRRLKRGLNQIQQQVSLEASLESIPQSYEISVLQGLEISLHNLKRVISALQKKCAAQQSEEVFHLFEVCTLFDPLDNLSLGITRASESILTDATESSPKPSIASLDCLAAPLNELNKGLLLVEERFFPGTELKLSTETKSVAELVHSPLTALRDALNKASRDVCVDQSTDERLNPETTPALQTLLPAVQDMESYLGSLLTQLRRPKETDEVSLAESLETLQSLFKCAYEVETSVSQIRRLAMKKVPLDKTGALVLGSLKEPFHDFGTKLIEKQQGLLLQPGDLTLFVKPLDIDLQTLFPQFDTICEALNDIKLFASLQDTHTTPGTEFLNLKELNEPITELVTGVNATKSEVVNTSANSTNYPLLQKLVPPMKKLTAALLKLEGSYAEISGPPGVASEMYVDAIRQTSTTLRALFEHISLLPEPGQGGAQAKELKEACLNLIQPLAGVEFFVQKLSSDLEQDINPTALHNSLTQISKAMATLSNEINTTTNDLEDRIASAKLEPGRSTEIAQTILSSFCDVQRTIRATQVQIAMESGEDDLANSLTPKKFADMNDTLRDLKSNLQSFEIISSEKTKEIVLSHVSEMDGCLSNTLIKIDALPLPKLDARSPFADWNTIFGSIHSLKPHLSLLRTILNAIRSKLAEVPEGQPVIDRSLTFNLAENLKGTQEQLAKISSQIVSAQGHVPQSPASEKLLYAANELKNHISTLENVIATKFDRDMVLSSSEASYLCTLLTPFVEFSNGIEQVAKMNAAADQSTISVPQLNNLQDSVCELQVALDSFKSLVPADAVKTPGSQIIFDTLSEPLRGLNKGLSTVCEATSTKKTASLSLLRESVAKPLEEMISALEYETERLTHIVDSYVPETDRDIKKSQITLPVEGFKAKIKNMHAAISGPASNDNDAQVVALNGLTQCVREFRQLAGAVQSEVSKMCEPTQISNKGSLPLLQNLQQTVNELQRETARAVAIATIHLENTPETETKSAGILSKIINPVCEFLQSLSQFENAIESENDMVPLAKCSAPKSLVEPLASMKEALLTVGGEITDMNSMESVASFQKPIQDLQRGIALIEEEIFLYSDDSLTLKDGVSILDTLSQPIQAMKKEVVKFQDSLLQNQGVTVKDVTGPVPSMKICLRAMENLEKEIAESEKAQWEIAHLPPALFASCTVLSSNILNPLKGLSYWVGSILNQTQSGVPLSVGSIGVLEKPLEDVALALKESILHVEQAQRKENVACVQIVVDHLKQLERNVASTAIVAATKDSEEDALMQLESIALTTKRLQDQVNTMFNVANKIQTDAFLHESHQAAVQKLFRANDKVNEELSQIVGDLDQKSASTLKEIINGMTELLSSVSLPCDLVKVGAEPSKCSLALHNLTSILNKAEKHVLPETLLQNKHQAPLIDAVKQLEWSLKLIHEDVVSSDAPMTPARDEFVLKTISESFHEFADQLCKTKNDLLNQTQKKKAKESQSENAEIVCHSIDEMRQTLSVARSASVESLSREDKAQSISSIVQLLSSPLEALWNGVQKVTEATQNEETSLIKPVSLLKDTLLAMAQQLRYSNQSTETARQLEPAIQNIETAVLKIEEDCNTLHGFSGDILSTIANPLKDLTQNIAHLHTVGSMNEIAQDINKCVNDIHSELSTAKMSLETNMNPTQESVVLALEGMEAPLYKIRNELVLAAQNVVQPNQAREATSVTLVPALQDLSEKIASVKSQIPIRSEDQTLLKPIEKIQDLVCDLQEKCMESKPATDVQVLLVVAESLHWLRDETKAVLSTLQAPSTASAETPKAETDETAPVLEENESSTEDGSSTATTAKLTNVEPIVASLQTSIDSLTCCFNLTDVRRENTTKCVEVLQCFLEPVALLENQLQSTTAIKTVQDLPSLEKIYQPVKLLKESASLIKGKLCSLRDSGTQIATEFLKPLQDFELSLQTIEEDYMRKVNRGDSPDRIKETIIKALCKPMEILHSSISRAKKIETLTVTAESHAPLVQEITDYVQNIKAEILQASNVVPQTKDLDTKTAVQTMQTLEQPLHSLLTAITLVEDHKGSQEEAVQNVFKPLHELNKALAVAQSLLVSIPEEEACLVALLTNPVKSLHTTVFVTEEAAKNAAATGENALVIEDNVLDSLGNPLKELYQAVLQVNKTIDKSKQNDLKNILQPCDTGDSSSPDTADAVLKDSNLAAQATEPFCEETCVSIQDLIKQVASPTLQCQMPDQGTAVLLLQKTLEPLVQPLTQLHANVQTAIENVHKGCVGSPDDLTGCLHGLQAVVAGLSTQLANEHNPDSLLFSFVGKPLAQFEQEIRLVTADINKLDNISAVTISSLNALSQPIASLTENIGEAFIEVADHKNSSKASYTDEKHVALETVQFVEETMVTVRELQHEVACALSRNSNADLENALKPLLQPIMALESSLETAKEVLVKNTCEMATPLKAVVENLTVPMTKIQLSIQSIQSELGEIATDESADLLAAPLTTFEAGIKVIIEETLPKLSASSASPIVLKSVSAPLEQFREELRNVQIALEERVAKQTIISFVENATNSIQNLENDVLFAKENIAASPEMALADITAMKIIEAPIVQLNEFIDNLKTNIRLIEADKPQKLTMNDVSKPLETLQRSLKLSEASESTNEALDLESVEIVAAATTLQSAIQKIIEDVGEIQDPTALNSVIIEGLSAPIKQYGEKVGKIMASKEAAFKEIAMVKEKTLQNAVELTNKVDTLLSLKSKGCTLLQTSSEEKEVTKASHAVLENIAKPLQALQLVLEETKFELHESKSLQQTTVHDLIAPLQCLVEGLNNAEVSAHFLPTQESSAIALSAVEKQLTEINVTSRNQTPEVAVAHLIEEMVFPMASLADAMAHLVEKEADEDKMRVLTSITEIIQDIKDTATEKESLESITLGSGPVRAEALLEAVKDPLSNFQTVIQQCVMQGQEHKDESCNQPKEVANALKPIDKALKLVSAHIQNMTGPQEESIAILDAVENLQEGILSVEAAIQNPDAIASSKQIEVLSDLGNTLSKFAKDVQQLKELEKTNLYRKCLSDVKQAISSVATQCNNSIPLITDGPLQSKSIRNTRCLEILQTPLKQLADFLQGIEKTQLSLNFNQGQENFASSLQNVLGSLSELEVNEDISKLQGIKSATSTLSRALSSVISELLTDNDNRSIDALSSALNQFSADITNATNNIENQAASAMAVATIDAIEELERIATTSDAGNKESLGLQRTVLQPLSSSFNIVKAAVKDVLAMCKAPSEGVMLDPQLPTAFSKLRECLASREQFLMDQTIESLGELASLVVPIHDLQTAIKSISKDSKDGQKNKEMTIKFAAAFLEFAKVITDLKKADDNAILAEVLKNTDLEHASLVDCALKSMQEVNDDMDDILNPSKNLKTHFIEASVLSELLMPIKELSTAISVMNTVDRERNRIETLLQPLQNLLTSVNDLKDDIDSKAKEEQLLINDLLVPLAQLSWSVTFIEENALLKREIGENPVVIENTILKSILEPLAEFKCKINKVKGKMQSKIRSKCDLASSLMQAVDAFTNAAKSVNAEIYEDLNNFIPPLKKIRDGASKIKEELHQGTGGPRDAKQISASMKEAVSILNKINVSEKKGVSSDVKENMAKLSASLSQINNDVAKLAKEGEKAWTVEDCVMDGVQSALRIFVKGIENVALPVQHGTTFVEDISMRESGALPSLLPESAVACLVTAAEDLTKELARIEVNVAMDQALEMQEMPLKTRQAVLETLQEPSKELTVAICKVSDMLARNETITGDQVKDVAMQIRVLHEGLEGIEQDVVLEQIKEGAVNLSMLQAIIRPIEQLNTCVALIEENQIYQLPEECLPDADAKLNFKAVSQPVKQLSQCLAIVEEAIVHEHSLTSSVNLDNQVLHALATPIHELKSGLEQIAKAENEESTEIMQDLHLQQLLKLAKPIQEIQAAILTVDNQEEQEVKLIEGSAETLLLKSLAEPLQVLGHKIAVIEHQQVLEGNICSESGTDISKHSTVVSVVEVTPQGEQAIIQKQELLEADGISIASSTSIEPQQALETEASLRAVGVIEVQDIVEAEGSLKIQQKKKQDQVDAKNASDSLGVAVYADSGVLVSSKREDSSSETHDEPETLSDIESIPEISKPNTPRPSEEASDTDENTKSETEERKKTELHKAAEEKQKLEAEAKAKKETEEKEKAEAKAKNDAEEEEKAETEARAKRDAEEREKLEAEAKAKKEGAEKQKLEAEATAKKEAEEKQKLEADAKAKKEAEEVKAEAKAKKEAEEMQKAEAEAKAEREAEEKEKLEAEAKVKKEAAEKQKLEAEATAKKEVEERQRLEAEAKAKEEAEKKAAAEAKAKKEAEEKLKAEVEAKAKKDTEEKEKLEAEAKAKKEAEEKAEAEAKAKKKAEEKLKAEAEAKAKKEAAEKEKADAEAKAKKEVEEKAVAEANAKKEAEEKLKAEAEAKAKKDIEEEKLEAQAKAKKEAEEKAAAEAKAKKEAEEKLKAEAEAKAKKDTEEKEKLETEAKAKKEAEEKLKADAEAKAKKEAAEKKKADAEAKAKKEAEEKAEAEAKAKKEAEEKLKAEAEAKAKKEAAEKEKADAEAKAKKEAEEKAEAEAKAKKEAEEKLKAEAEAKAKKEAEEKLKADAEAKAKKEAEEKLKAEAEAKAKKEAAEKEKVDAEAKARKEAKEKAEAEAKTQKEAEEKLKADAEAKAKKEAAEKEKADAEAKAKKEAEEKAEAEAKAKKEAEEKAEAEAKAKKEAEEKLKAEAEAKAKKEAEEKAEAEAKTQKEAEEKLKADAEAKAKKEAAEKEKADAEAKARKEAKEKAEAEAKAKKEAEEKAEAEAKAKKEAEEKLKAEAEAKAKKEAEEKTEAEAKAKKEAAEKEKADAEAKAKKEAEEKAEAEAKAKKEAEEKLKADAEAKAKKEAAEKKKADADAKAKKEAEEKAEAEAKAKKEAEEKLKAEAEAKATKEAEEKAEAEAKAKKEAAEKEKADGEAKAKKEEEQKAEAEAKAMKQSAGKKKAEAEAKAKKEAEEKAEAEVKAKKEAAEKEKADAEAKAKKVAEEKAEADAKAKKEAEEKLKAKVEAKAKKEPAEKEKAGAEAKAKKEEEEKAKAEAKAKKETEEKQKAEAEAKTKTEADEKQKAKAEAMAKKDAKKQRLEAEAKEKRESEEKAETKAKSKREAEEKQKQDKATAKKSTEEKVNTDVEAKMPYSAEKATKELDKYESVNERRAERSLATLPDDSLSKSVSTGFYTRDAVDRDRKRHEIESERRTAARQEDDAARRRKQRLEDAEKFQRDMDVLEERQKRIQEDRLRVEELSSRLMKEEADRRSRNAWGISEDFATSSRYTPTFTPSYTRSRSSYERDVGRGRSRSSHVLRTPGDDSLYGKGRSRTPDYFTHTSLYTPLRRPDLSPSYEGLRKSTWSSTSALDRRGRSSERALEELRLGTAHLYEEGRKLARSVTPSPMRGRSTGVLSAGRYSRLSYDDLRGSDGFNIERRSRAMERRLRPMFCARLSDRAVSKGCRVRLACSVLGTPDLRVTWCKDGFPLFSSPGVVTKEVDGLCTLEIPSAEVSDTGVYSCAARDKNGEATTSCTLTVFGDASPAPRPPIFLRPVQEWYRPSMNELTLETRVSAHPMPRVTWLLNGSPLRVSDRYEQQQLSDGTCRLIVRGPDPAADSGRYTCRAANLVSTDHVAHTVQFTGRDTYESRGKSPAAAASSSLREGRESRQPRFSSSLVDSQVPHGGTLALQVQVTGYPRPRLEWLLGSEPLPRTSSRYRLLEDGTVHTLLVSGATAKDAGQYTVRAVNPHGSTDSSARVDVVAHGGAGAHGDPAMFLSRPETLITVAHGEDITVSFRLGGDPKPKVTWMKGTRDITNSGRAMRETVGDYVRLTLKRAILSDAGTYFIVAKNIFGTDRAFFTVQFRQRARSLTPGRHRRDSLGDDSWEHGGDWSACSSSHLDDTSQILRDIHERSKTRREVPGPIAGEPEITDSGRNCVTLSWPKPLHSGDAPVLAYRIEAWRLGSEGGARWSELGISPTNAYDAFGLVAGVDYRLRITPRNRHGWGEPIVSAPLHVQLSAPVLPEFTRPLPGQIKALRGQDITVDCQVRGDPSPATRWSLDSEPLTDDGADGRVATSRDAGLCRLSIRGVREADAGRYCCEASNGAGRVSTFVRLMVVTDPLLLHADTKLKRDFKGAEIT